MSLEQLVQNVQEHISQGEVALALSDLESFLAENDGDFHDDVILFKAQHTRLLGDERRGTITRDQAQVEQTRLEARILDLLRAILKKKSREKQLSSPPGDASPTALMPEDARLEKILGINNLKQIHWIEQGTQAAKSVCRILTPIGLGTGFLIGSDLLMTNNHVIPNPSVAADSSTWAEFNYQFGASADPLQTCRYSLVGDRFYTNRSLDFTIVGIIQDPARPPLEKWGYLKLNAYADPVRGEHDVIIQHPSGGLKQIALTANQVVGTWDHRLHYTTDTMPGSSGSPVFNDLWQVIAIHHSGGDLQTNARGDKRFINEGVLMSAIQPDAGEFWPQ